MGLQLLLVEDDDGIAAPLQRALGREDYDVVRAACGKDALDHLANSSPALMILDLGLPDIDGLEVCKQARNSGFEAPIIILTARGDELDRVVGLDSGADDYMAKPVALAELLARVRALLRRSQASIARTEANNTTSGVPVAPVADQPAKSGGLRVDTDARRVFVQGTEVQLSAKEYDLLALLYAEAGKAITRERIMEEVWDEHWFGSTKTLDVTLGRLRGKLAEHKAPVEIVALRGVGFRLEHRHG
jgi:DNA-binding response OmpR family regulator